MVKNLMPEVAKLLGVELGEEFTVYDTEVGIHGRTVFLITDKGLVCKEEPKRDNDYVMKGLLLGTMEIEKLPWVPKVGDSYYYPSQYLACVQRACWSGSLLDLTLYALGMAYRTEETAIANLDKDCERLGRPLEE